MNKPPTRSLDDILREAEADAEEDREAVEAIDEKYRCKDPMEMWERITKEVFASTGLSPDVAYYLWKVGHELQNGTAPREALKISGGGRGSDVSKYRQARKDAFLLQNAKALHENGMTWVDVYRTMAESEGVEPESLRNRIDNLRRAEEEKKL